MSRRQTLVLLAAVGIGIALYLTLYKVGVIGVLSCSIGSCETVNTSKWSMLMGIPIAAWGLAAYAALLVVAMAGSTEAREASVPIARMLVALAAWSVLFSAWLTYLELFVIHAICIWCVTSALLWVVILAVSVADLRAVSRAAIAP
ncbi:MAG TPA: vitamin K epoxide reductase family protein [Gemmatimonadaceae bacterium]|nr:vitamin K epoxide reductase family protein [Gemmatimonadaceae bacterium]